MSKKLVFLTGATGTMGMESLKKFMENQDKFTLRVLARPSEANKAKLAPYQDKIEIIWGDLNEPEALHEGVKGADYVLHVGAILSPICDGKPELAMYTNYGSTLYMLDSIRKLGQTETTHFVYIGTLAETGDRRAPIHWGRVGDPLKPSVYDYYAISKCCAERAVIESGLKYWVSIRQSGMLPSSTVGRYYPIISHNPFNNPWEWSTAKDSGNLMCNVCKDEVPEEFWGKCYNLSSGASFRSTTYSHNLFLGSDQRETYEPKWVALGNFHGQFYLDADKLEEMVPFRCQSYAEVRDEALKGYMAMAKAAAAKDPNYKPMTKAETKALNKEVCSKEDGVLQFVRDWDEERIKVWFDSVEKYKALPEDWKDYPLYVPCAAPTKLDHGFDESKPVSELGYEDLKQAAEFRGGKLLSTEMTTGDMKTKKKFRCAFGHEFEATPNLVFFTGHWCPDCLCDDWNYGAQAQVNPFFNQVWEPLHKGEDPYSVKMECDGRKVEEKLGLKP